MNIKQLMPLAGFFLKYHKMELVFLCSQIHAKQLFVFVMINFLLYIFQKCFIMTTQILNLESVAVLPRLVENKYL